MNRAVLGLLVSAGLLRTQESSPVIRTNVHEVLLDVIVRHKNLGLVKDLTAADFTVTEDGVAQKIKTFRFVGGSEAQVIAQLPDSIGPAVKAAAAQANSLRQPNFVTIVIDQMGPDSRKNALEAANDFLKQQFQENTYAAVFGLNIRLNVVQGFTNDRAALQNAVRKAVSGNSMELASASANVLNQTNYTITGGQGGVSINAGVDPTKSPDLSTSSAAQNPLSEAQQAIAGVVSAQRDMVSYGTGMRLMTALLRLVQNEARLPGRKTVLYLSEGLTKPPDRNDLVRTVVSAANHGNVSFYCIDVRGLSAGTSNGMTTGLTNTAGGISKTQGSMSSSPSAAMAQARQFDVMDEAMASHVQLNMAELAESTGGFAIFNTNNFKKGMARIMEDVRTHYEISYVPSSAVFDGHFRTIKVSVQDPRLLVQSRDGYFAVPELNGQSVQPYEMPGLRALGEISRRDFDFHAAALRFKPLSNGYRYEVSFALDTANLTTQVNPASDKVRIHVTFLALVKDTAGQIVNKVSQEIDREVPNDKLEQFRRGQIIFTSPVELSSGRYTIEAAVTDPEGGRASTRRLALVVPKPGEPSLSNISLVHRLDALDGPRDPGNPLEFDGGKVLPALSRAAKAQVKSALFFVVYPAMKGNAPVAEKPKVLVQFLRDGAEMLRAEPDAGAPDEMNSFPILDSVLLPAGNYVVRVTVEQAGRVTSESTGLTVNP